MEGGAAEGSTETVSGDEQELPEEEHPGTRGTACAKPTLPADQRCQEEALGTLEIINLYED